MTSRSFRVQGSVPARLLLGEQEGSRGSLRFCSGVCTISVEENLYDRSMNTPEAKPWRS